MSNLTSEEAITTLWGQEAALGLVFSFMLLPPGEECLRLHRLQAQQKQLNHEEDEFEHEAEASSSDICLRKMAIGSVSPFELAHAPLLMPPPPTPQRSGSLPVANARVINPVIFGAALHILDSSNRLLLRPADLSPRSSTDFSFHRETATLFGIRTILVLGQSSTVCR